MEYIPFLVWKSNECELVCLVGVEKKSFGTVPHFAGIQDQIRLIFGNLCSCGSRVNFVFERALTPDNLDGVADGKLGKIVEGV